MEREDTQNNPLYQRIFDTQNNDDGLSKSSDDLYRLHQENAALKRTLRLQQGLRQRFEQLYDTAPTGYLTISGDGHIVEANLTLARLLGITRSELIGQSVRQYITDSDYTLFLRHIQNVRESGVIDACTLGFITKDGDQYQVHMESAPNPAEAPSPYRTVYANISIDHQTRAHKALPEFEKAPTDKVTVQPTFNQLTSDKTSTTNNLDTPPEPIQEELEKTLNQKIRELEETREELNNVCKALKKTEETTRQYQERLAHAARLNTIGEMTSGLAHEINQPLMAISAYVQSCLNRLASREDPQRLMVILEQVLMQTKRVASIVDHLRNFVTKGKSHRETTNPLKIIGYALKMVHSEMVRNRINFDITQDKSIPDIQADPIQIEQVVLNLVKNAIEAMENEPQEKRKLHIVLNNLQTHISVAVHDNGIGIDEEDASKVCTPFFSTKENGMGLGLSICRTIVEDHGGKLSYNNNDERGATFQFTLAVDGRRDTQ